MLTGYKRATRQQVHPNINKQGQGTETILGSGRDVIACTQHDDFIKWKYFPYYWPFERGIHRSPVNSPHKGQWRGALMFSLIIAWINGWVNNCEAGDLRRYRAHSDVTVMSKYMLDTEMTYPLATAMKCDVQQIEQRAPQNQLHRLWWDAVIFVSKSHPCFNEVKSGKLVSPSTSLCPSIGPSICASVDTVMSALYLQQYWPDPFEIYTCYLPTSESVSLLKLC